MATEVRVERSMGIDKCVIETITQQDLNAEIAKNPNARSYREDHTDGVYTLVEEFLIEQGEPQFAFDSQIGTEPLETHPIWSVQGAYPITDELKKQWATYKRNPNDSFLVGKGTGATTENPSNLWQPATEANSSFATFYEYIKQGVENYYVGRITVRVTVLESGAPNMTNLGRLDVWWGGWPSGFVYPPGCNFILSGVRSQQEGDFYRTTYEFLSSQAGTTWDADLYQNLSS
jgi:hypothetical protein